MNKSVLILLVVLAAFVSGAAAHWLSVRQGIWQPYAGSTDHEEVLEAPANDEAHDDHLGLSKQAIANLQLEIAPIDRADYQRVLRIPGQIVEQPGHSAHILAAPVHGMVERALALPGMAVNPGDPLFEIQVLDERVFQAQLRLLESVTRQEIIDAELTRLAPLAISGMVAGRQKLDLQYERKQLETTRQLRIQELYAHGLDQSQVDQLLESRQLLQTIVVHAPDIDAHTNEHGLHEGEVPEDRRPTPSSASRRNDDPNEAIANSWSFTMERLLVAPGQTVERGDGLCDLAHHAELYIQGQVFESEIEAVQRASDRHWPLTVEFGVADQEFRRDGIRIRYVANHVDPETQTFLFYAPLRNEVVNETFDAGGRRFRSWRFKVGQRVQVLAPVERHENCLKLPAAAVVQDGPNRFVFRQHADEHDETDKHDETDPHHDIALELEPVPVAIDYRDQDFVVLRDDGQIQQGDVVAMNAAYQLLLAFRAQSEQGGGHHHDHDH